MVGKLIDDPKFTGAQICLFIKRAFLRGQKQRASKRLSGDLMSIASLKF